MRETVQSSRGEKTLPVALAWLKLSREGSQAYSRTVRMQGTGRCYKLSKLQTSTDQSVRLIGKANCFDKLPCF